MLDTSLKRFRFFNYLTVLFILLAALLLVRTIVSFSFTKKTSPVTLDSGDSLINMKTKDIMQYSAILEKNPFGRPMTLHSISVRQETEKPFSSLSDLVLIGTVVGPAHLSYAVFQEKSRPDVQEVIAYRQKVFNYGILSKISMSSVEIERDSVTYTLTFPSEEIVTDIEPRADAQSGSAQGSFARKVGDKEYVLDSSKVQQALENPEQILTDARLLPNFVNGKQEGFRISEVVSGGLYQSLGLSNGDILLRVNGLEISNPEVAMQAMTALKGMNKVNLDIMRDGKNMSMSYQMR